MENYIPSQTASDDKKLEHPHLIESWSTAVFRYNK